MSRFLIRLAIRQYVSIGRFLTQSRRDLSEDDLLELRLESARMEDAIADRKDAR